MRIFHEFSEMANFILRTKKFYNIIKGEELLHRMTDSVGSSCVSVGSYIRKDVKACLKKVTMLFMEVRESAV